MKKINFKTIISELILASFIISIILMIYKIIALSGNSTEEIEARSRYMIILVECMVVIIGLLIPIIISKKTKIIIPAVLYIIYILFIFGCIVLGEVFDLYNVIPTWDVILHIFSGLMLGLIGLSFVYLLNKDDVKLSPIFIAIFIFCFAISIGVVWEIIEFTNDSIFAGNAQRYLAENSTALIGREALMDTMEDLIVDTIGALVISVFSYISIKHNRSWIDMFIIKKDIKK